ncbi:MAG: NAD(P)H-dependent oxidoreductase subunit E [Bacteroidetes bacterium]|nr:NAD(P)H-dependent oxidoreductase subunit E [Bacteroidota bacterium]
MNTENKIEFSPETLELVSKIISHYPEGKEKSALVPVLHIAQAEFGGWLSVAVMDYVALLLKILPIEVYEVATFYTMFNTKPVGNCVIEICRTGPCWLLGAEEIILHLEKKLNVKIGETTTDGRFTIKAVECLADCDHAPVIEVSYKYFGNMTKTKVDEMIENFKNNNTIRHTNPFNLNNS